MLSPVTNKALRMLWRFRWGYRPPVKVKGDQNLNETILELSKAGCVEVDARGPTGAPVVGARYVINTEGRVFWDNWGRDRVTRFLAVLAIFISIVSLVLSIVSLSR